MTDKELKRAARKLRMIADAIDNAKDGDHVALGLQRYITEYIPRAPVEKWVAYPESVLERFLQEAIRTRLKPKPLECWVNVRVDGVMFTHSTPEKAEADSHPDHVLTAIHMQEVGGEVAD